MKKEEYKRLYKYYMKFIKYKTKSEFLDENLLILQKEEAKNEIMIGITLEHPEEKVNRWLLGRIEEKDEIKVIFLVDDDKEGLLLYSVEKTISNETAEFLIDNIVELNVNLKEVLTTKENAQKIAKIYSEKTNKIMQESEFKYIFKFDKFNEEHILNKGENIEKIEVGTPYLKDIENNVKEMYQDTYNGRYCSDIEANKVANIFFKKGLYVLKNENDEILSQAVTVRKQLNGCAIGGVITPKKYRGYGYAKRCVYALCEILLKQGYKFVVLHVNPQNEAAISVYKRIGFEQIDETEKIKFV